jgi:hypothetical protein
MEGDNANYGRGSHGRGSQQNWFSEAVSNSVAFRKLQAAIGRMSLPELQLYDSQHPENLVSASDMWDTRPNVEQPAPGKKPLSIAGGAVACCP